MAVGWGVPLGMTVWICRIRGMMVGPAGVGVRRAAGGRTGAGPVMMRGAAWADAAREKARAAAGETPRGGGRREGQRQVQERGEGDKERQKIS